MSQDTNHWVVVGRLTKDIGSDERSFGYIGNGTAKAVVSIAVNSAKKQGDQWVEEVSYFDIQIFGKTAENLKPYLTKGKQILAECHLKQDRWEKDGQKRSAISIVADRVQLIGGNGENSNSKGSSANARKNANSAPAQQNFTSDEDFPEDIPF